MKKQLVGMLLILSLTMWGVHTVGERVSAPAQVVLVQANR